MLHFKDELRRLLRLLDLQPDVAHLPASRRALGPHRLQRLHTAFVSRPPRLDALAQPHFFLGELPVELLLQDGFIGERRLLPPQVRGVVAGPGRQLTAIELDDPRRETLEERAVVRHEHHRAAIVREEAFQPGDGVDVQMVRRLVEQQQVRLADQRARHQHTPAPSARQRVHHRGGRQRESRQHEVHVVLAQPRFVLVEMMRVPFGDDVEDGAARRERHVLLEPRHPQRRLTPDVPGIGRSLAADDLQQRRFAGAVSPDHRHPFPWLDLQRHLVEQRQMAIRDRHAVQGHKGHSGNVPQAVRLQIPDSAGRSASEAG